MKSYLVKTFYESEVNKIGLFAANDLEELYWLVDEYYDPNQTVFYPLSGERGLGVMFEYNVREMYDVEDTTYNEYEISIADVDKGDVSALFGGVLDTKLEWQKFTRPF